MEKIIALYDNLGPPNPPEVIKESWENLQHLYQKKSIIQTLFQIYDSSIVPFHKFHALFGIHSSLIQSYIHYSIEELSLIQAAIVNSYIKEPDNFFKSKCVDIICFLLNQTKQSWTQLDNLIFYHQPSIFKYFKILFYYSLHFTNLDLILLKTTQAFQFEIRIQLEALEVFLFFNKNSKQIENLTEPITNLVNQVFTSKDISILNYFLQIYEQFFQKMYWFCPIAAFLSSLTNLELHPSILVSLRDFFNFHIEKLFSFEFSKMNEEDRNSVCTQLLVDILTTEIHLSHHLYSIEFDESIQNTSCFMKLFQFIPKEPVESLISELLSSSEPTAVLTALSLFEPFIKTYDGDLNCYTFLTNCLTSNNSILIKMAIETLYETRAELESFLQPDIIAFLMAMIQHLYTPELYSEQKYFIIQLLFFLFVFASQIEDISALVGPLFEFGINILKNEVEAEIIEILNLFNYLISHYFDQSISSTPGLIELLFTLISQKDCIEEESVNILALSFSCLTSVLYKNHSLLDVYIPCFIEKIKDDVFSFKFLSLLLAFYPEIVKDPIVSNLERIIAVCNDQTNYSLQIIAGLETEITVFSFFEGKIDIIGPIFELLFKAIPMIPDDLHPKLLAVTESFFKWISLIKFRIDSLFPQLLKLLGESTQNDTLVLNVVSTIAMFYRSNHIILNLTPFFEYSVSQIEKIFSHKNINQYESILIEFWKFFNENIDFLPSDEFYCKITEFFFNALSEKDSLLIRLLSLKILLACETKINFLDKNVFEKFLEILQYEDDQFFSENRKQILIEIKCVAAQFLFLLISKNQDFIQDIREPLLVVAVNQLNDCHDEFLSEVLIVLIISLLPPDNVQLHVIQLLLIKFPIVNQTQYFELSYKWLLSQLSILPENVRVHAHRSIVRFLTVNIQQLYEDQCLSFELLSGLLHLAHSISQEFVASCLSTENALETYYQNIKYITQLLETSKQ